MIEEEMVVKRSDVKTIVERSCIVALTSSSNRTVSPITIAPSFVGVNAAHVPRPMNGGNVHPSTTTFTSLRGNVTL
jgi:hypothetical protein